MSGKTDRSLSEQLGAHVEAGPGEWRRYRELLTANTGAAGELAELTALMPKLNKRQECVEKDLATIARAKALAVTIRKGRDLAAQEEASGRAIEAKAAEARELQTRVTNELVELRAKSTELTGLRTAAQEAADALALLKGEQPDLLADFADVKRTEI